VVERSGSPRSDARPRRYDGGRNGSGPDVRVEHSVEWSVDSIVTTGEEGAVASAIPLPSSPWPGLGPRLGLHQHCYNDAYRLIWKWTLDWGAGMMLGRGDCGRSGLAVAVGGKASIARAGIPLTEVAVAYMI
jgi:hypothetical protein